MEQSVGIYEAKTHLSKLIEGVSKGAEYTITQRGKPVAQLIPYNSNRRCISDRSAAACQIRRYRQQQKPTRHFESILKSDQR